MKTDMLVLLISLNLCALFHLGYCEAGEEGEKKTLFDCLASGLKGNTKALIQFIKAACNKTYERGPNSGKAFIQEIETIMETVNCPTDGLAEIDLAETSKKVAEILKKTRAQMQPLLNILNATDPGLDPVCSILYSTELMQCLENLAKNGDTLEDLVLKCGKMDKVPNPL
ncbi:uncharacterized protein RB166_018010 [Leptodactylus fuscus]